MSVSVLSTVSAAKKANSRAVLFSGDAVMEAIHRRETFICDMVKGTTPEMELVDTGSAWTGANKRVAYADFIVKETQRSRRKLCPYGQVGDYLAVREIWKIWKFDPNTTSIYVMYKVDGFKNPNPIAIPDPERYQRYVNECSEVGDAHWRPSFHMPVASSRLLLRIVDIRIDNQTEDYPGIWMWVVDCEVSFSERGAQ